MENVNSIQAYREQFGFTQEELGERVGVTRQTIAAWEKGERSPSLLQIAKVAKVLGMTPDLLIGQDQEAGEPTLLFRADDPEVLSRELRALLSRCAEDYAMVERLVGEVPVLPESRPLDGYDPYTTEKVAGEVRDWLGVEDAPLGDVLALLENRGLKIIRYPLPEEVSGFSAYTNAWGGIIFVNKEHPPERQYFTALHELAHLIFHRHEYDGVAGKPKRGDPREKAAHHLAAAVLLPRTALEQELHGYRNTWLPEPLLVDIKRRYGVSIRTILLRAADVGFTTRKQAGQQVGTLNKRYTKTGEPGEVHPPQLLGRLKRLVMGALYQEKLTTSRAAEILRLPLMEVREELSRWLEPVEVVEGAPA